MYTHCIRTYYIPTGFSSFTMKTFKDQKHMVSLLDRWNGGNWIYSPVTTPNNHENLSTQDHRNE